MAKSPDAFRTISEVAEWLDRPAHVLRFWESKFTQVKPVKRAGGRRYYRRQDMLLLGGIKTLLHDDGMTIKGVQKLLREHGVKHVTAMSQPLDGEEETVEISATPVEAEMTEAPVDAVEEPQGQLLSFPSPEAEAEKPKAKRRTSDKPAFEREPEQAMLFDVADSVAPELDDIYRAAPDAADAAVEEPDDVPLPFDAPAAPAEEPAVGEQTDTVAIPASVEQVDVPDEILVTPFPGHLTALLEQTAQLKEGGHDDALAIRNRLLSHLKTLKGKL
ncbi:MerR family transcriptional regulator [Thalassobius sp. MITS945101]|uniref:MerR family transcriptional regulator n=1 Tax=Thalassobius sp. MITS945101 TaxID=3096994 RepID=UPI0039996B70